MAAEFGQKSTTRGKSYPAGNCHFQDAQENNPVAAYQKVSPEKGGSQKLRTRVQAVGNLTNGFFIAEDSAAREYAAAHSRANDAGNTGLILRGSATIPITPTMARGFRAPPWG